ncbi:group II truncated hemoglobin [soil metagenome]
MAVPSLYEWIGGAPMLEKVIGELYRRVPNDELLAPIFARMSSDHVAHVAAFVGEVFGGPKVYTEQHGGHANMIRHHLDRNLTEAHRKRWMQLLFECADDLGMPSDPEFRSSAIAYFEWGSRLAVINSQPGAAADENQPMPTWGWGETKGPYQP